MEIVFPAVMMLAGLGAVFGIGLAVASRAFAVATDPRVEQIEESLPGANCGACGFAGCSAYAEAVAKGVAPTGACIPGGASTAGAIAGIMGVEADIAEKRIAVVHCQGRNVASRFQYAGVTDCRAAALLQGGFKSCAYGCLGLGSCVEACPFGGIQMVDGLPVVNPDMCVACGKCVEACPRDLISLHPVKAAVQVMCRSTDKGGVVRKVCSTGCIGCKKCEKVCDAEAIHVENFLARIDDQKCTQCGKCLDACPTHAIARVL